MKYIIDVPDEAVGFMDGEMSFFVEPKIKDERRRRYVLRIDEEDVFIYIEPNRKTIEDEVWEFADFMCSMGVQERYLLFGFQLAKEVAANLSYQEAKAKYEARKKQKDEIRVGDEVKDHEDIKAVVLDICMDGEAYTVYTENRICEDWLKDEGFVKTGRHFNEVGQMLEKMRGGEE